MARIETRSNLVFALLAGSTGVAGSYAVAGVTWTFIITPLDAFIVRTTPGWLVAWLIVNVGDPAHLLHITLSALIATGLLTGTAYIGIHAAFRMDWPVLGVVVAASLAWGVTAGLTLAPLHSLGAAFPVALFTALATTSRTPPATDPSRRRVLTASASALAIIATAIGLNHRATQENPSPDAAKDAATSASGAQDADVVALLEEADAKSLEIVGTNLPGLVSKIDEFYNVDINQIDPQYPADEWGLTITGNVHTPIEIDFEQLTDRPIEHRFMTLRCVGDTINGQKMDNAIWTGTPLKPLLDRADPNGACGCAMLYAKDDYFVQFPLAALENGFLAWRMNGKPLPTSHGHPVRVLVPGHWGETNVKWLNEIELLDEELDGYWEERGWHGTGPVHTVAKIWDTTMLDDGRIELAGHAYAGTRGIRTVEVSTDGGGRGGTWTDAELSEPLPGIDVWRQWRHVFDPDGTHEVVVRAIDGEGTMQPADQEDPFPSGATGWVSTTVPQ